ncbi:MAG: GvpL/GvpF family gas vesicle protein [Chloroflexi bacterium]|nr:GvpL/GvpF family gas vesicle protein [Chloroflexota bacterium]
MTGVYVYAILGGEYRLEVGDMGLPDGLTRVSTLPAGGLSAVVSDYSGPPFTEQPKAELLRCLTIHQRVVEHSMAGRPVLPVKFGTALPSATDVRVALHRWQGRIAAAFAELGDVVEIEVAAVWDLKSTFADISRQPEIASLAATIAGGSPEETLARRVQIGKLVKESLDKRREEYRRRLVHDLSPLVRHTKSNPLPSDEMVLNSAFLVERSRLDDFYAAVHRVDRAMEDRLTFRCVGPLPPYSFATVEMLRPNADEVEAARRLLELGEVTSEAELKSNFRRLSAHWHPDRNPGSGEAAQRFAALAQAYATLLACGRGQWALETGPQTCHQLDLRREAVEAQICLTIGQPGAQIEPVGEESHELSLVV